VNIQLKQRLVGAIVLVALAVIFIPMLLPGGGDLSDGIHGSNIPPEPDYRFSSTSPAPSAPPMAAPPSVPMDDPALAEAASHEPVEEEPVAKPPVESTPVVEKPAVEKPVVKKPKTAVVKKAPVVAKTTTPKASPIPEKSPQASGWVVQVGSFSSSRNAQALRDKLRKQGYTSFVEATQSASGSVYRVRVGPVVSRTSAEQLRKKLTKVAGLKGLVQAYP
jgi:DedD protein